MDTLIVIIACLYILFESYTALEAMPKVSVFKFFNELVNPYTLKYWACGLTSLALLYHADMIKGWLTLLVIPPLIAVSKRFLYRIKHSKWYRHN